MTINSSDIYAKINVSEEFGSIIETSGAGTVYPSGAPEFTPDFSGVRVTRSLDLYV
jgi:hypothetical protein